MNQEIISNLNKELEKVDNLQKLKIVWSKFLGTNGVVKALIKSVGKAPKEQRKEKGRQAQEVFKQVKGLLEQKQSELEQEKNAESEQDELDITAPGVDFPQGNLHPITQCYEDFFEIAKPLGFSIVEGPEVETDWYNFEALNIPKHHPARDTQDTFFINNDVVLRTHTSPMQIRFMEGHKPPIRILVPGRTYRVDSDATHSPMFNQLEGLVVDKGITFADLKGTLEYLIKGFFGKDRKIRLRPHHFPFTEPSAEIDVSCGICNGKGCKSCKHSGWLEILGAGMVHPNVLKNSGIDPGEYTGFAFGFGMDRVVMLKYNIDDIRLMYEGDLRFLKQF